MMERHRKHFYALDFAGDNIRREKVRIVEEIVTLRPTEPVPTFRSFTARYVKNAISLFVKICTITL
jgi:hypothetical protein